MWEQTAFHGNVERLGECSDKTTKNLSSLMDSGILQSAKPREGQTSELSLKHGEVALRSLIKSPLSLVGEETRTEHGSSAVLCRLGYGLTLHRGCEATTGKRTVGHLASPKEPEISWLRCRESPVSSDGVERSMAVHAPSR